MLITNILGSLMPNLLGGLAGGLVGAATKVLKDIGIDLPSNEDPQKALEKIIAEADPSVLADIRKADLEFESKMAELKVDVKRLNSENTQNARAMQRETKSVLVPILAVIILLYSFTLVGGLFFMDFPPANRDLINVFFGLCLGYSGNVVTFYFGSSEGSRLKDKKIGANDGFS